jgi:hypothetical protein
MNKIKGRRRSPRPSTPSICQSPIREVRKVNPYNKARTSQDDCFWTREQEKMYEENYLAHSTKV